METKVIVNSFFIHYIPFLSVLVIGYSGKSSFIYYSSRAVHCNSSLAHVRCVRVGVLWLLM